MSLSNQRGDGFDMNVFPAWREGITGKGIVVTILDDGLETDHPDLERNYVSFYKLFFLYIFFFGVRSKFM
jgi:subtilisin family serine protease